MFKKLLLPLISVVGLSTQLSSTTVTTAVAGAALLAATPAHAYCELGDPYFDPIEGFVDPCAEINGGPTKHPEGLISCSVEEGTHNMCDLSEEDCTVGEWVTYDTPTIWSVTYEQCMNVGGTVL